MKSQGRKNKKSSIVKLDWDTPNYNFWLNHYALNAVQWVALSVGGHPDNDRTVTPPKHTSEVARRLKDVNAAVARGELKSELTPDEFYRFAVERSYELPHAFKNFFKTDSNFNAASSARIANKRDELLVALAIMYLGMTPRSVAANASPETVKVFNKSCKTLSDKLALAGVTISPATLRSHFRSAFETTSARGYMKTFQQLQKK